MSFITDPATKFDFMPADFVPFKDKKVCEYVRSKKVSAEKDTVVETNCESAPQAPGAMEKTDKNK